jgi:hypothetical protein
MADEERSAQRPGEPLARYAEAVVSGLETLMHDAATRSFDLEALLREVRLEARKQRANLRESEDHVRSDRERHLSFLKDLEPGLRNPDLAEESAALIEKSRQSKEDYEEVRVLQKQVTDAYEACILKLEALRTQKLAAYRSQWETYLQDYRASGEPTVADGVAYFWERFSASLWPPEAGPTEDGFLMVWDRDQHHMEVEIYRSGSYDWFYRVRGEQGYQAENDVPLGQYSDRFGAVLRTLGKAKRRNG